MDLFDIAVASKLAGGGGGGGGDLTTATLSLIVNNRTGVATIIAGVCDDLSGSGAPIDYALIPFENEYPSGSYTLALYKGAAFIMVDAVGTITTSGNIQDLGDWGYLVTGDCTITIS